MQRSIRTALLTDIWNLGLYYYMVTYVLRPFYCLFIQNKILCRWMCRCCRRFPPRWLSATLSGRTTYRMSFLSYQTATLLIQKGKKPVLRIHYILVWIRIRIYGFMPLTNGSGFGSGSCYVVIDLLKMSTKVKNSRNQGFSYYFCMMIEGSGSGSNLWRKDTDPEGQKTCGSGRNIKKFI